MEQQQTSGVSRRGFIKLVMTAGLGLAAQGALSPSIAWAQASCSSWAASLHFSSFA